MLKTITIDADFPSGSAGEIRRTGESCFEVAHKPEHLPDWFQQTLEKYWGGGGVPKEYMFHVRVSNHSDSTQQVSIRFLFSPSGCSYLALPWWIRRDTAWQLLSDTEATISEVDGTYQHLDVKLSLHAGHSVCIGSAPYESPADVDAITHSLASEAHAWTVRELGRTAQGRPILALESETRPLALLASATMQACEPTWTGLHHAARAWMADNPETNHLREQIQLCVVPLTNPDGLAGGFSVTNAEGEVPKFSTHMVHAGRPAPLETEALWNYVDQLRPTARIEMHAHFTQPGFSRSIGMQEIESLPLALRNTATAIERAIDRHYHHADSHNRRVRIDPRIAEHDVYGVREMADTFGLVELFLQAISDPIDAHNDDVFTCIKTVAEGLIDT